VKFSLKFFLCAIALVCVGAFLWRELTARQRAVNALRNDGVDVSYVYPFSSPGDWRGIAHRSAPDSFAQWDFLSDGPVTVVFTHTSTKVRDDHVANIAKFHNLECLLPINPRIDGNDSSELSEASLLKLGGLHTLRYLDIEGATLTRRVLRSWVHLREVEQLYLMNTNMSDELIRDLPISPKLKVLGLTGTRVTANGIRELGELPHWTTVTLPKENVSDEDIRSLKLQFPYTEYTAD
jgi:hypothetical protein